MRIISMILVFLLSLLAIAFTLLNAASIEINYFLGKIFLPLPVILLVAFGFGALLSMLFMGAKVLQLKTKNYLLSNKLKCH